MVAETAFRFHLVAKQITLVTRRATQLFVFALEWEIGIAVVLELDFAPAFFAMTVLAFFAILSVMTIVLLVTGDAQGFQVFLKNIAFMAIDTDKTFMRVL